MDEAIDYLVTGLGEKLGAALTERPDVEVLDGDGKVIRRTRKVRRS